MSDEFLRRVNLVEVLKEELEDAGQQLPADLTDEQLQSMSEDAIRQHYHQSRAEEPHSCEATGDRRSQQHVPRASAAAAALMQRFPAQTSTPAFKAWFPALTSTRGLSVAPAQPRAVVLCFHSSGNAEGMFTSEGTGSRRVRSALLDACRANDWLLMAPQLPGRSQRSKEQALATLQDVAQQLLTLVAPAVLTAGGRYSLVGHSMGCWAAYELMLALRAAGLPDPAVACFSAMPWPHIPPQQRPWRQQRLLDEAAFKEECRGWDINEVVFSPGMWELYQPMLRADFRLFDEYQPSVSQEAAEAAPFATRLRLFWGEQDRRVQKHLVEEWRRYVTRLSSVRSSCIPGHHLWPVSAPAAKSQWLQEVAAALQEALLP